MGILIYMSKDKSPHGIVWVSREVKEGNQAYEEMSISVASKDIEARWLYVPLESKCPKQLYIDHTPLLISVESLLQKQVDKLMIFLNTISWLRQNLVGGRVHYDHWITEGDQG